MGKLVVSNLSKAYKRYPSKWARVREWLTGKPCHDKTWVLRDINFTVNPGEAIGIVGVNGAGKSTLLKIITGTTQPTSGNVQIEGRVAAILELGMGFHPDFTGRQNARIAGQLAGLPQNEIDNLLADIEKFADIGDYFDMPLRIYSSGMNARLAFAVATAAPPDILIVDEALSVGDIAFQAKCMHRMQVLIEGGTTVIFVSHALNQIRHFCSKALYLSGGGVLAWGAADEVCDFFQNDLAGSDQLSRLSNSKALVDINSAYDFRRDPNLRRNSIDGNVGGSIDLEFLNFGISNQENHPISFCRLGDRIKIKTAIVANAAVGDGACVGLLFSDKNGFPLMACNTNFYDRFLPALNAGEMGIVEWEMAVPFAHGEFRIDVGIKPDPLSSDFYDRVFCVASLTVVPSVDLLKKNFGGYLFNDAIVKISVVKNGV